MTPPIVDVFTAADTLRAAHLTAENHRLRVDLATARNTIATLDARIDQLQRANEARESRGFAVRQGLMA